MQANQFSIDGCQKIYFLTLWIASIFYHFCVLLPCAIVLCHMITLIIISVTLIYTSHGLYHNMGHIKQISAFKHVQNAQIQISCVCGERGRGGGGVKKLLSANFARVLQINLIYVSSCI